MGRHRCNWTVDRGRQEYGHDDDGAMVYDYEVSIRCGGPDGCGATWLATGAREIMRMRAWLAERGYDPDALIPA